jgi:peroxiredoxin
MAAVGAIALLAAFTAAVGWNLLHGRHPECRCFGQIGNGPIGVDTVVRNVVLIALGISVLVAPPVQNDGRALAWAVGAAPYLGGIAVLGMLLGLGYLMIQMINQQGRILIRLDELESAWHGIPERGDDRHIAPGPGLAVGAAAPAFRLATLAQAEQSLDALLALGKPVLMFFVHPTCGPCRALVAQILRWHDELATTTSVVVITEGDTGANREFLKGLPLHAVLLQANREVAEAYGIFGTPGALLVNVDATVGSAVAMGSSGIAELVVSASRVARDERGALPIGTSAPDFSAFTPKGERVRLADWRGEDVVLLFWDPACGFCRQARSDVVSWARRNAPSIVLISTAPDEELLAHGFEGRFLLDAGSRVRELFGAQGTPMALSITAAGLVDSELAAGLDAIRSLIEATGVVELG